MLTGVAVSSPGVRAFSFLSTHESSDILLARWLAANRPSGGLHRRYRKGIRPFLLLLTSTVFHVHAYG